MRSQPLSLSSMDGHHHDHPASDAATPSPAAEELKQVLDHASPTAFADDFGLPDTVHDVAGLIQHLEQHALWTPERLRALRRAPSASSLALADDASLLQALSRSDAADDWSQLVYLELHDMQLSEEQMDLIAKLPLNTLAICNSGLTITHLARLLPLGGSLQALDISGNPNVDDRSLPTLAFLSFLTALDCDGTSVTMQGLRDFAKVAEPLRRFPRVQITPPQPCRDYLSQAVRSAFYAFDIREPFIIVSDPNQVSGLSDDHAWENYRFHQRARRKAAPATTAKEEEETEPKDADEAREVLKRLLIQRQEDLMVLNHCSVAAQEQEQQTMTSQAQQPS